MLAGQGSASGDQLLGGRPIQTHVSLRGVHGLGDTQPVPEQVTPEGEGGVPVNGGRRTRDIVAARVGHDMGGGERDPTLKTFWVFGPGSGLR